MKKEQINSCIELTKEIMNRHYQGNLAFVAEQLHKNCMWIGSNADEFYQGKDSIIAVLKRDAKEASAYTAHLTGIYVCKS